MDYKGYQAHVAFDENAKTFFGKVLGTRDVITFESENARDIEQEFHHSVDDYLAFCAERNEKPEKPFSGRLALRIEPALHRQLYLQAGKNNKSINGFIVEVLRGAMTHA